MVTGRRYALVSDLHGDPRKYSSLISYLGESSPDALFLAGDLLPPPGRDLSALGFAGQDFVFGYLVPTLRRLRSKLERRYPRILLILGNDDDRIEEAAIMTAATEHLWTYVHNRRIIVDDYPVYGYSCIPPSPFINKDWERYDVSRYVDPGCVSPEEGSLTVPQSAHERRYSTIARDLERLTGTEELENAIFLFHAPPYQTALDTADLDGKRVEGVPLDPHIGSIAIRRMIEVRSPRVTLHGHVHEAYRLTGAFSEQIGSTWCLSAAGEEKGGVVVEFDPQRPESATRLVLP